MTRPPMSIPGAGLLRWAVWLLLCLAGQLWAGDVAKAAIDGSLWSKSVGELSQGVLRNVNARAVDATSLLMKRGPALFFGGLRTGDVLLQIEDDDAREQVVNRRARLLSTTVYNKGDDGEISKADFDALLKASVELLTQLTQVDPVQRKTGKKETGLRLRSWVWETPRCAVLLEASATGTGKKYTAEFIRLTMAPNKEGLERGGANDAARRAEIKAHVKHVKDGTVWIDAVPMVDQGEKGYCVPASISRVFAYYGMDGVDQHALAALCKSTGSTGTTLESMEKALRSISGSFHMSVYSWKWTSITSLEKELVRMAQKKRIPPELIQPQHVLELLESKPALLRKGMKDVRKQIDAGIPIVWAVMLGVFPEPGLPQSAGGHMRLIIGYNEQLQTIVYTDSWGAGHEVKMMPFSQAYAITQGLYVLRPKR